MNNVNTQMKNEIRTVGIEDPEVREVLQDSLRHRRDRQTRRMGRASRTCRSSDRDPTGAKLECPH